MKRRAFRLLVMLAAAAMLLALAVIWLLNSGAGRDWALARVQHAVPGVTLHWQRAEGRLAGPLSLHGLSAQGEGFSVELERLALDLRLWPLLRERLVITELTAAGVRVRQLAATAPDPAPRPLRWPDDLPRLDLPLSIDIERLDIVDLRLSDATGESGDALLNLARASARLTVGPDRLVVHALSVDGEPGRLQVAGHWQSGRVADLDLQAHFLPNPAHSQGSELRLRAIGKPDTLTLHLEGRAPEPLNLVLTFAEAENTWRWNLTAQVDGLEPGALLAGRTGRYAGRLEAAGQDGAGEMTGELDLNGLALRIEPSQWTFAEDGRLTLDALRLGLLDGDLVITGPIETGPIETGTLGAGSRDAGSPPLFDLALQARALRWGDAASATELREGAGSLTGDLDDWRLSARAQLRRDTDSADLRIDARGDRGRAGISRLRLETALGEAVATGELGWQPALRWQARIELDRVDPAYLAPGYPGQLSGRIDTRGALAETPDGHPDIDATLVDLRGRLRGRPVSGTGELALRGGQGQVRLALAIGDSLIATEGRIAPDLDLALTLERLRLSDLLAEAEGAVSGHARLRGNWRQPDIEADLRGFGLAIGGLRAEQIELLGRLPASGSGALTLRGQGLEQSGVPAATLSLTAQGSLDEWTLDAEIVDPRWRLSALGRVRALKAGGWRGRLQRLRLALPEPDPGSGTLSPSAQAWTLAQPVDWRASDSGFQLSAGCLRRDPASLCLDADWPRSLTVAGRELPLALTEPWLNRDGGPLGGGPVTAQGEVELELSLDRTGAATRGRLTLSSGPAQWRQTTLGQDHRVLFDYRDLRVRAELEDERIDADLSLRRAGGGGLQARLETGVAPDSALTGTVDLNLKDLAWLELLSPDLVQPRGRLEGRVSLAGRRAAPQLAGQATLHSFSAELPVLGIDLRDSRLELSGAGAERLDLDGRLDSGEGALDLTGTLALDGSQPWLRLRVQGERFLAIDNPELRLLTSPELDVEVGQARIGLKGAIAVPEARIDLERVQSDVTAHPDVVVIDPDREHEGRRLPIDADLRIALGDRVELKGFGLDGRLAGALRLRQAPGREARAGGALQVSGHYTAYDTELTIARGRLVYANGPLDNPTLDVRAERRFENQTVGVQIRGSARNPRTTLISDPALDSTETLSWLVLGRPLRAADGEDSERLGAAAMALGAGGNLIAQQVGSRVGLDLGVKDSQALGGSAFTVGKYLSPRLLLSYGVSLLGNGQVVGLGYRLRSNLEVEVESGLEQSATLKWRLER